MNIEQELHQLEQAGLRRELSARPAAGGRFELDGRTWLNFSSNDYLDLANHPEVKQAAIQAVERWGCGAGASRLMAGHLEMHEQIEARLAGLLGHESALVFGSGFLANQGIITSLVGRGDAIFADRLNHASLVDGARLSSARLHRYRHNDPAHLETLLMKEVAANPGARRLIVTDSIFSMDGDIAPLAEIEKLARRYDSFWTVDEAHAIGIFGPDGGGVCRDLGLRPDLTVGTLSKALGGYGGFVGCSATMRDLLINKARSFIYSTGLPPACLGGGLGAIEVLAREPDRGPRLLDRARLLRRLLAAQGMDLPPMESQILPIMIGENQPALELARRLNEQAILVTAIRPPTVPKSTARLRLSVTLAHQPADLERTAAAISQLFGTSRQTLSGGESTS